LTDFFLQVIKIALHASEKNQNSITKLLIVIW